MSTTSENLTLPLPAEIKLREKGISNEVDQDLVNQFLNHLREDPETINDIITQKPLAKTPPNKTPPREKINPVWLPEGRPRKAKMTSTNGTESTESAVKAKKVHPPSPTPEMPSESIVEPSTNGQEPPKPDKPTKAVVAERTDLSEVPKFGNRKTSPWHEWLDGSVYKLHLKELKVSKKKLAAQGYTLAKSKGLKLETSYDEDADILYVQAKARD